MIASINWKCYVSCHNHDVSIVQLKGLFGGQAHKDSYEYLHNFVDVYLPFSFWCITQEAIRSMLFPFYITEEIVQWSAELSRDSITSWEESQDTFLKRFLPLSMIVKLQRSIENFKKIEGEPLMRYGYGFENSYSNSQIMEFQTTFFYNISIWVWMLSTKVSLSSW